MARKDMEEVRALIESEGVRAAAEALIGVCRDPKAPAPAKSAAGAALLRAAGMLDRKDAPPDDDTPLSELSGRELQSRARQILERQGLDMPNLSDADASTFD